MKTRIHSSQDYPEIKISNCQKAKNSRKIEKYSSDKSINGKEETEVDAACLCQKYIQGSKILSNNNFSKNKDRKCKLSATATMEMAPSDEIPKDHESNIMHRKAANKTRKIDYNRRLAEVKTRVETAIKEHKIFSMSGHYTSVRKALCQRGWVEKVNSDLKNSRRRQRRILIEDTFASPEEEIELSPVDEYDIINRMLKNTPEDLCWLSKPYPECWKDLNKCDVVNRLPKACFANKVGLCNALSQLQWFNEEGVCSTQYPRTYNMSLTDEMDAFREDYRLTACINTLKWLTSGWSSLGEESIRSVDGEVDVNVIEFALRRCAEFVKFKQHEDIDLPQMARTWEHQWDHFLTQYYKLINDKKILRDSPDEPRTTVIVSNAETMLNLLKPYWPQIDIDGYLNLWIIKPGGRCCGNGILIRNQLEEILDIVHPSITKETRYVVQKYIEKPLLIYDTKFDIRQWFLITNVYPLTVWMYRESYLRFCSSTFDLSNFHESIHLCNNAVQRKYKNGKRDRNLPNENMWDCYTFQTYLRARGYPNAWDEVIYPGMKESFIGALLTSQDHMERRKNSFELYGADFMISELITDGPWLIEINSNPAMDSSTSVTARMCPQVLEDVIKVVIDRKDDKNASTGAFEMVFKQNCPPIPPYLGMSLSLKGKKIFKSSSYEIKVKGRRSPQYSDSDVDDVDEGNNVERHCRTDFMQPIKNIRSTIEGQNKHAAVECLSDSFPSDQSFYTIEGKEIELKTKKIKRKKRKVNKKSKQDLTKSVEKRNNQHQQTLTLNTNSPNQPNSGKSTPSSAVSMADFDTKFVRILQQVEKAKSLPTLHCPNQSSIEYFQDWKYKVDETRRNCKEMLDKLKAFKESNSKLRFGDVLQRQIDQEVGLINKLNNVRGHKSWTLNRMRNLNESRKLPTLIISSESGAVIHVKKNFL